MKTRHRLGLQRLITPAIGIWTGWGGGFHTYSQFTFISSGPYTHAVHHLFVDLLTLLLMKKPTGRLLVVQRPSTNLWIQDSFLKRVYYLETDLILWGPRSFFEALVKIRPLSSSLQSCSRISPAYLCSFASSFRQMRGGIKRRWSILILHMYWPSNLGQVI